MSDAPSIPKDNFGRSMEVIAVGLPRTGTLSMSVALQMLLGGPVMHGGSHLFARADDGTLICLSYVHFLGHGSSAG